MNDELWTALEVASTTYNCAWTDDRVVKHIKQRFHVRLSAMWPSEHRRLTVLKELAAEYGAIPQFDQWTAIWQRFIYEVAEAKMDLERHPQSELNKMYWSLLETTEDDGEYDPDEFLNEETPHNSSIEPLELQTWLLEKEVWYPREAACLLLGLNPASKGNRESAQIEDAISRAQAAGSLPAILKPFEFLNWASKKWPLPTALEAHWRGLPQSAIDRPNYAELELRAKTLAERILELEEPRIDKVQPDDRLIRSLHKMILAMAMQKYKFPLENKNSSAAANIENAMSLVGLSLSQNKIREHLVSARESLKSELEAHAQGNAKESN
ncbi:MAG TPA: hypothetical protein VGN98_05820 [Tianweitania sediminis]|nr:hypothetical protein [Tianweitania sediminis]